MKFIDEFKAFAIKGNVIDLAVGVVIGSAFGKIVSSLVNDIIMPFISLLTNNTKFSELKIIFVQATDTTEEIALRYGSFIQNIIDFLIIAFCIFLVIKMISKVNRKKEAAPVSETKPDPTLVILTEIRDELSKR